MKCYERVAGFGAKGIWNLAGEFGQQLVIRQ